MTFEEMNFQRVQTIARMTAALAAADQTRDVQRRPQYYANEAVALYQAAEDEAART